MFLPLETGESVCTRRLATQEAEASASRTRPPVRPRRQCRRRRSSRLPERPLRASLVRLRFALPHRSWITVKFARDLADRPVLNIQSLSRLLGTKATGRQGAPRFRARSTGITMRSPLGPERASKETPCLHRNGAQGFSAACGVGRSLPLSKSAYVDSPIPSSLAACFLREAVLEPPEFESKHVVLHEYWRVLFRMSKDLRRGESQPPSHKN